MADNLHKRSVVDMNINPTLVKRVQSELERLQAIEAAAAVLMEMRGPSIQDELVQAEWDTWRKP